jgi:hypothetical protein
MSLDKYGPFANVVVLASALVATFAMLLLKMLGGVKRWTWLASGSPPFLVTAGARALAVALMAVTYVTIDKSNYRWFAGGAVVSGISVFIAISRFENLRQLHVWSVPLVGPNGQQLLDKKKSPIAENVVVGLESELRDDARIDFAAARKKTHGLSLQEFMSGYGAHSVNSPAALWDSAILAKRSSTLTTTLMWIVLFSVMALFWSALILDVAGK